jgi:hypothetical protein
VAACDVAAVVSGAFYARHLASLPPRTIIDELELAPAELAYVVVGVAQLAALLVAAVFFIRWLRRAYGNLEALAEAPLRFDPRWAIWGWFVPFLNLVRPQQVVREVWDVCEAAWQRMPDRVVGLARPPDHVNLWWGLFLATSALANGVGRLSMHAEDARENLYAAFATMGSDAFDVIAALVAVRLVLAVRDLQRPLLGHAPQGPSA